MALPGPEMTLTVSDRGAAPPSGALPPSSWGIPPDVLGEAVGRIRTVAWLYVVAFALAGPVIPLLLPRTRAVMLQEPIHWVPAMVSIAGALVVVALLSTRRLSDRRKTTVGLAFEVLGSIGIASAEYHHISSPILYGSYGQGGFGLSWVAVWVVLFSIVVPVPPRISVVFASLSLAAVPGVYAVGVNAGLNLPLPPDTYFFALVLPNLIVLAVASVGSRVVYRLGTAIREAREMGSYRLVERLGRGGMGEVWRAEHRHLARPAAIKLIRPKVLGAQDPGSRELLLRRFEREAQTIAMLRSPHTVALYDFGVTDDGTFYHVMELLDGFDLSALVRRFGVLPPERVVHLLRQVCHSLGEAHASGLVHRDVKPANVYLCRYGREVDFTKVLDFGLVKQRRAPEAESDQLTAQEIAGGTPAFMSPEQALGEGELDGRSDLYALGCVAYWLLTGTTLFRGRTVMETIVMHVHAEPEPPSRRSAQAIPAALEALVLRCLAKEPGARPQTAEELDALLAAVPLERQWTPERAQSWWSEQRRAAAPASRLGALR